MVTVAPEGKIERKINVNVKVDKGKGRGGRKKVREGEVEVKGGREGGREEEGR